MLPLSSLFLSHSSVFVLLSLLHSFIFIYFWLLSFFFFMCVLLCVCGWMGWGGIGWDGGIVDCVTTGVIQWSHRRHQAERRRAFSTTAVRVTIAIAAAVAAVAAAAAVLRPPCAIWPNRPVDRRSQPIIPIQVILHTSSVDILSGRLAN